MPDIKDRIDKAPDRIDRLLKKYPVVFAAVFIGGYVVLRGVEAVARWVF